MGDSANIYLLAELIEQAELTDDSAAAKLSSAVESSFAELDIDTDRDIIVAEVGDCPDCWRAIATRAVFEAAAYMSLHLGDDRAIAEIQAELAGTLDADSHD